MLRTIQFLKKMYYWRKLKKLDLNKSFFILTGDIDSTALTNDALHILQSNLEIAKEHDAPYWIFITPTPTNKLKELVKKIRGYNERVIFGAHGFTHIPFNNLSYEEQLNQWISTKKAFENAKIEINATRTPYLSLNRYTYQSIADLKFKYDFSTSFGFQASKKEIFLKPRKLKQTIFFPITLPTDTYFRNKSQREMEEKWIQITDIILEKQGIISVLAHPTHKEINKPLEKLLEHIKSKEVPIFNGSFQV